jgi:hypothetical protein
MVLVGTRFSIGLLMQPGNRAGQLDRTTGSSCPARFPGYISSPMEKRVPTTVCVYYCSTYSVREGGGGDGGHVLRETTSRGQCELVCPSRANERGGEGYCVKEGEGEEGERERERAGEVRLYSIYYRLGY